MENASKNVSGRVEPACPYFGECGGCLYQDLPYERELSVKEEQVRTLVAQAVQGKDEAVRPIVPSPREYHYRHRLDLRLLKTKEQKIFVGFSPRERFGVVNVDQCPIAMEPVSAFIPELKRQAAERIPRKYRLANLVVRCGDAGVVHWGGIGKKSLQQEESDFLWTEINGLKVYYALDTFFQANLSILPRLFEVIRSFPVWSSGVTFLDLYGGVGLFSLGLHGSYDRAFLMEDSKNSIRLARYNVDVHKLGDIEVIEGRVEDFFEEAMSGVDGPVVAMIDPPRAGLSAEALKLLASAAERIDQLLYLSCNPEALGRDLAVLTQTGWSLRQVVPFDFFPKTRHVETLVWLTSAGKDT